VTPAVWTIGYERLRPESLVAELEAVRVTRVLDVRIRPQSRKPGMSKTRLTGTLAAHGIRYEHRRPFGTPPELRALFRRGRIAEAAPAFRAHVEAAAGDELDALAAELTAPEAPRTALLCLEEDPAVCHRRVLTDALRARRPDLRVVDL
jgi:uncharacterized protein (DUF488 family)